jgi:diguanylate cyclase (GGDEF)-like protein/PAS domain S-box-containing protein
MLTVNSVALTDCAVSDTAQMPGIPPRGQNQEPLQTGPRRALLRLAVISLLVLCLGALVLSRYLITSHDELDNRTAEQRGWQMLQAFNATATQLDVSTHDLAMSDGAEEFIRKHNLSFLIANVNTGNLARQRVDFVMLVDRNAHILHSAWLENRGDRLTVPAPAAMENLFLPQISAVSAAVNRPPQSRVLATAHGPALLSMHEVSRADGSRSTGAVLLFARFIKAEEIARIRESSALDIDIRPWPGSDPKTMAALPDELRHWVATPGGSHTLPPVQTTEKKLDSYVVLSAPTGSPTLLLSSSQPRTFHALGVKSAWLLLICVLAPALSLGTSLVLMLIRTQRSLVRQGLVHARYRNVTTQLGDSIVMIDAITHRVVDANEAVLSQLLYSREDLLARVAHDIYPDIELASLQQVANGETRRNICLSRVKHSNGNYSDCEVSITKLADGVQRLLCLVGHDISHRKAAEEQQRANQRRLLHIAQHDPLTTLPNRLYLHARLPRVLKQAADSSRQLALIYLDIDHFKKINDSRGHGFGDKLLQVVAQRLRSTIGAQDSVVRMGGDEFVIVASLLALDGTLESLASRLQSSISAPIGIDGVTISVTASIGVSVYPRDGLDLEVLLKHADIALYQAKEAGRSCHRMFSADMDVRVSEDVALEQALRHAIGSDQFYMDFQPVVDINTNRVISFEALMRWRHPELGIIPPARFVPVAIKSDLIVELGQRAMSQVFQHLRTWLDAGLMCFPVSVNVAPNQLLRTDFPAMVSQLASETSMDVSLMRFEITEAAFLQSPELLSPPLRMLRDMGSQVLIDDFGAGYPALGQLAQLPVDALKIDRSFVVDIDTGGPGSQIVGAVIDTARRLRLRTVGEGIETRRQAEMLRAAGCDFGQGYLYSRPLSVRRTRLLLEKITAREAERRSLRVQQLAG